MEPAPDRRLGATYTRHVGYPNSISKHLAFRTFGFQYQVCIRSAGRYVTLRCSGVCITLYTAEHGTGYYSTVPHTEKLCSTYRLGGPDSGLA